MRDGQAERIDRWRRRPTDCTHFRMYQPGGIRQLHVGRGGTRSGSQMGDAEGRGGHLTAVGPAAGALVGCSRWVPRGLPRKFLALNF